MIFEKFSRNGREKAAEITETTLAQGEDVQREVLIGDTLKGALSSWEIDPKERSTITQSIERSYHDQSLSALRDFLNALCADNSEARKIQEALRLIAVRHEVLDFLSRNMHDDGVSKGLSDPPFLQRCYRYDSEDIVAMVERYGWRYVPLIMERDDLDDDVVALMEGGSQGGAMVDFDGIHDCTLTGMLRCSRDSTTFQEILHRVRTISLRERSPKNSIAMIDTRKDAVCLDGGLAGAYAQSQDVAVNWSKLSVGTCLQMERRLRVILGHGKLHANRHGRGFLVTQGSVPLGIIKAFGEPSFIAARTVYDGDGRVLLLRGMVYAIGIGKLDSTRRDVYGIESDIGRRLKGSVQVEKKKHALVRSFLPNNGGVVPQRSVDLEVLKNYIAPQQRALFFKAMRMTQDSDIYKSLHTMVARAEQSPSHHISEEDVRRVCWTIATDE